jgi:hypothetical protein
MPDVPHLGHSRRAGRANFHGEGGRMAPAALIMWVPTLLILAAGTVWRIVEWL